MIVEWARLGTHTASAIFRDARKFPSLRHAVKTASRDWWANTTKRLGREYPAMRTKSAIENAKWGVNTYNVPSWETIVFGLGATDVYESRYFRMLLEAHGAEWVSVNLCHPYNVFHAAANEFGLTCVVCGAVEKTYRFENIFLCEACGRKARRHKTQAHYALKMLESEIRQQARQHGP